VTPALDELSQEEVESLFGEAIDALLDAQTQHERELRRLAERLGSSRSDAG